MFVLGLGSIRGRRRLLLRLGIRLSSVPAFATERVALRLAAQGAGCASAGGAGVGAWWRRCRGRGWRLFDGLFQPSALRPSHSSAVRPGHRQETSFSGSGSGARCNNRRQRQPRRRSRRGRRIDRNKAGAHEVWPHLSGSLTMLIFVKPATLIAAHHFRNVAILGLLVAAHIDGRVITLGLAERLQVRDELLVLDLRNFRGRSNRRA